MLGPCALRLGIEALRPAPRCIYAGVYVKKARDPWTSGSWPRVKGQWIARLGNSVGFLSQNLQEF